MSSASCPRFLAYLLLLFFASLVSCAGHPGDESAGARRSTTEPRSVAVSREDIASVLRRRTPELMAIDGVTGTGEGRDGADTIVVVFVARKTDAILARVPREVDGWRVVIREVGDVTAPPP
jgi:hypothetical protein